MTAENAPLPDPCWGGDEAHARHVAVCVPFYEWRDSTFAEYAAARVAAAKAEVLALFADKFRAIAASGVQLAEQYNLTPEETASMVGRWLDEGLSEEAATDRLAGIKAEGDTNRIAAQAYGKAAVLLQECAEAYMSDAATKRSYRPGGAHR